MKFLKNIIGRLLSPGKMHPRQAYDHWSACYDHQPANLVMAMDEKLFSEFVKHLSVTGKTVIDVGCGTGRHWKNILDRQPAKLVGYDVSAGMLEQLKRKYPGAEAHLLQSNQLHATADQSADLIVSTLTIGYIKDLRAAFSEWNRVLKTGGRLIISDFHPETLLGGGKRTFDWNNRKVEIKNYIHTIGQVKELTKMQGWVLLQETEMSVDESAKELFVQNNMLPLYSRHKGMKLVYGIHLIKTDVVT
jgi:ubiquinone/menaquinone biosynthesis C-methylase UbiE